MTLGREREEKKEAKRGKRKRQKRKRQREGRERGREEWKCALPETPREKVTIKAN